MSDLYQFTNEDYKGAKQKAESLGLDLLYSQNALTLSDSTLSMSGDFKAIEKRLMPNKLFGELLIKAAKPKGFEDEHPLAVDATAGMGEDALLLSAAGFRVLLIEYDPVIAALLYDTLKRALSDPLLKTYVSRMQLICGDSTQLLKNLPEKPSVVYLDPMFPKRQKSGLIKKKFQLLQKLESPCASEDELLNAAVSSGAKKIIIKRPLKGPFLADKKPDYSLKGNQIRYDCIITP